MTVALGQPIHLLIEGSTDVRCGADDVTYVSTIPDAVTCPACVAADDGPPVTTTPPAPIEDEVTTPEALLAWRTRRKLSQTALAELLDLSTYKTVYRWEKGTSPIPRAITYALAYLGQRLP
jgi:DNA-binding XRE family transcriptional regulator